MCLSVIANTTTEPAERREQHGELFTTTVSNIQNQSSVTATLCITI